MIKSTVGRIVWIFNRKGSESADQPEAAQVAYVNSDTSINVGGLNKHGHPFALSGVPLWGDTPIDGEDENSLHAEWMPYQVKMAAQDQKDPSRSPIQTESSADTGANAQQPAS
jgi:hypothetical protein